MQSIITDLKAMLSAPFVGSLDIKHLFLLVGLVLVFILAWNMVLSHVRDAAAAVV